MAFTDLIPASLFAVPAHVAAALAVEANIARRRNGCVSLRTSNPFAGSLVVAWERGCPRFNENLAAARLLKNAGHGTYRPECGGWVFTASAVRPVVEAFDALFIAPEVVALLDAPPPAPVAVAAPARVLHGSITLDAGQWLVRFGGNGTFCPRPAFAAYLDAARAIKAALPASRGFNRTREGWSFVPQAAGRIIAAFPIAHFDHPAALVAGAVQYPAPAPLPVVPVLQADERTVHVASLLDEARDLFDGRLPNGRTLYPHQVSGVEWMLTCRDRRADGQLLRGCILADDMGLGKTTTALVAVRSHKNVNRACQAVVICPRSLVNNWTREASGVGVSLDRVTTNHHSAIPAVESIRTPFVLVVDEAHAFQNLDAARTKAFVALANSPLCEACYLLTGTPLKNGRPVNLLPLLVAINHGVVAGREAQTQYRRRYCGPREVWTPQGRRMTYDGATNLGELHGRCRPALLRRTKAECTDLPPKIRSLIAADVTPADEQVFNDRLAALRAEYQRRLRAGQIRGGADRLVVLGQVRQAGELAKVGPAIQWAEEVREQGGQCLIFTHYRETAEAIAAHFGVPALTGETSDAGRTAIVDDFQAGRQPVFAGTIGAGGVGLTLHANGKCRDVLLVSRPWTPGDAEQCEDRAHRIGQTGTVNVGWMQYGPADQQIDPVLLVKSANASEVVTGERAGLTFGGDAIDSENVLDAMGWND